jgi:hypothetical protein
VSLETRARAAVEGLLAATAVDTEAELDRLRRTHRRRSATRVAAAGLTAAAIVVAGATLVGNRESEGPSPAAPPSGTASSTGPLVDRSRSGALVIPDTRSQQVVVEPEITTDFSPGERMLRSTSTDDPTYDGDGSIELSVGDTGRRQLRGEGSCADAPESWYVMTIEPNATFIDTGRCDDAVVQVGGYDYHEEYSGTTLRMFVTDRDPRAFRRCFEYSPPEGCDDLEHTDSDTPATMRLATYEWRTGPTAVHMFGHAFPARRNVLDQTWSLTHAAAAESGARTLSFPVDASSQERIAQVVYVVREDACDEIESCSDGYGFTEEATLPVVELSIDGEFADDPPHEGPFFTRATWVELPTGEDHDISVRLVGGDPASVDVGVVIYEAD